MYVMFDIFCLSSDDASEKLDKFGLIYAQIVFFLNYVADF
jgi:hypothetical protein